VTAAAEGALAGRRVIELADESGAYCGKLLADMGADVIKIEPPGGDPTRRIPPFLADRPGEDRGFLFLYMNTNKRSATLDIAAPEGRERFLRLAASADLVVETLPPGRLDDLGLGYAALTALNPGLVLTSITGFGQTGPQRNFASSDLVASALGGAMQVIGEPEDPPVALAGSQAHVVTSVCAAASSLIALHHSRANGCGQHVDVSALETVTAVTHICGVGKWLDDGIIPRRNGTSLFASVPSGAYRCSDGLVYVTVNRPHHWQALAQWIHEVTGNEEVLDPMFEGPSSKRLPYRELLDVFLSEMTSRLRVGEVYREGQRRHIAFTPVNGAAEVAGAAHLAARGFFVEVDHPVAGRLRMPGAPYLHARSPWKIRRAAPRIGEHDAEIFGAERAAPRVAAVPARADGTATALEDLRVLEFTAGMAGPWIGRFMAWCGADVIKVESQKRPSVVRLYVPPREPERGLQPQCSPWFTDWDAGKRFVSLDLTRPEAVELAKRLVARADVVVENYSAGVMQKLGLGYEQLRAVKDDIILLSTSGYGDTGPDRSFVTWGPNIEALSGSSVISGFPQRDCTITQYAYPDALSALHGLVAVMCALEHRAKTGQGQYVNLSQLEATVAGMGHVMLEPLASGREPRKLANASLFRAPHGCYRCRGDDRWCVIVVADDAEWERFCTALERPDWAQDPRFATLAARLANAGALDALVEEWTADRDAYDVMSSLQAVGIAAGVVQNVEDQFRRDPQLASRRFFEEIEHLAKGSVVATGIPLGLTATPGGTDRSGAAMGQDNEAVFGGLLGMTPEEIRAHVDVGAIEAAVEAGPGSRS
jgi:crotonobetainyl-CoA:carnitine CoA-transferase CaiB-like acyl-CoA transferase